MTELKRKKHQERDNRESSIWWTLFGGIQNKIINIVERLQPEWIDRKLWLSTHALAQFSVKSDYYDSREEKNLHNLRWMTQKMPLFIVDLSAIFTLNSQFKRFFDLVIQFECFRSVFFFYHSPECKQTKIGNKSSKSHKTNVERFLKFANIR